MPSSEDQDRRPGGGRSPDAGRTSPLATPRDYEPPALCELKTTVVTTGQLEQGYEVVGADGRTVRHEYKVLAYVVEDPADARP